MPLLRFGKNQQGDDGLDQVDDIQGDGAEGGLLMTAGPDAARDAQPAPDVEPAPAGAAPADDQGASDPLAALEEPAEATEDGEQDEAEEAGEGSSADAPAADDQPANVQTVSAGGDGDDALALFKDVVAHGDLGGLTSGLDEITMEELLAELREVRAMLPPTPPDAEDAGRG